MLATTILLRLSPCSVNFLGKFSAVLPVLDAISLHCWNSVIQKEYKIKVILCSPYQLFWNSVSPTRWCQFHPVGARGVKISFCLSTSMCTKNPRQIIIIKMLSRTNWNARMRGFCIQQGACSPCSVIQRQNLKCLSSLLGWSKWRTSWESEWRTEMCGSWSFWHASWLVKGFIVFTLGRKENVNIFCCCQRIPLTGLVHKILHSDVIWLS